ncbi:deoxyribodipyrimidine photo-lyase [Megalodesulfovibrio gigas]|uniref:Deoxyribodipyrimidine photo-lyase n=1 Tax=Megalodesulfovibrio gigas (strain ATCC 19364 / DSM 1382 / NCIMB 9332 / VKM B-1759) TaxID=1121448 RepID=T2GA88_MEGG1|nr:deoxyribodipyrimidine photo-lyase [Megalodesulfovibrio gigas]AGW13069.1 putative deoxyribodipyrimidine photo-lyase [Megalodesulfovibrio gigas DSM 1382 = ATCC 19364]
MAALPELPVLPDVDPRRVVACTTSAPAPAAGRPAVYWMHRDQRVHENFGLLHAQALALRAGAPLVVVFCLAPQFLHAAWRQYAFMLEGLQDVARQLHALGIPFVLLQGDPGQEVAAWCVAHRAGVVTTDFDPLRLKRQWLARTAEALAVHGVALLEVDSRNIVPCRAASAKREYAARTLRPRIHRLLPEFLHTPPAVQPHPHAFAGDVPTVDLPGLASALPVNRSVPPVPGLRSGPTAALAALQEFVAHRLRDYDERRNDPNAEAQSRLSPYLHFGQVSALRVALAVQAAAAPRETKEVFLEELVVRRELADNFCLHTPDYDALTGCPAWAQHTLDEHRQDVRSHVYSLEEFEQARTGDALWNAAQQQLRKTGAMHGYLRMYWAKKILEWTETPEQAMAFAIQLNDTWQLDGRDANGYTGVAWSIGGVHDRPWKGRPVFGTIRFMNEAGCRRKFDVPGYIARMAALPEIC